MLGLGTGSVLWQRWSGATFTSASLTLGGLNPLIKKLGVLKRNKEWKEVLLAVLYFVNMQGKFVVLQVLLESLKEGIGGNEPNVLEAAVGIYALMLVGVSLVHTVKALT